jgi:hypothetical protein
MSKNPEVDCDALLRNASKACPMPRANVREAVRRECTAGLCAKRVASRRNRLLACGGLLAFIVGGSAFLASGVFGIGYASAALWGALGWAIVLLAVLAVNLRPQSIHPGIWRALVLVGVPGAFYVYLTQSGTEGPSFSEFIGNAAMCVHVVQCGVLSSLVGAIASAGMFYVWRASDPFSPRLSGVALGLAGGIAGALATGFVCPGQDAWHVVFGHGLSLVVLAVGGAAIGRRVLSP